MPKTEENSLLNSYGIILLAAGQSARLGKPKQLLNYKGKTLLAHSLQIAIETQLQPIVTVLGANLDILKENDKDTFKTAMEIDQRWVIEHAAIRQEFIDQAQSVNLFFRPDTDIKYLHACHFMAWKKGLKTLYYCRSEKIGKADKVAKKIERRIIEEIKIEDLTKEDSCLACEG